MKKTLFVVAMATGTLAWAAEPPAKALAGGGKMVNCPSAVPGAKSEINELKDKLEITVTGGDEAEIRKRAKHVVEVAKANPTSVKHVGNGHGGGGLGMCPVVLKDTTVTAHDVPGGSKLTVKPTRAVDFEWLKKETHSRQAELESGGGGEHK